VMPLSRRDFLKSSMAAGAGAVAGALPGTRALAASAIEGAPATPDLVVARGGDPGRNCLAALTAYGLGRVVRPGQRVVIKPNPVGTYPPERAVSTHPEVVRTVVRECIRLGAREVLCISHDTDRNFQATGLARAIEEAGGKWKAIGRKADFRPVLAPRASNLSSFDLAVDLLEADVFINLPIAKHHAGSQVTLAMKNLMGVCWDRLALHSTGLQQGIAELASAVRHDLVVMDANFVLKTNGPVGPGQVENLKQVLVCADPVAADAYAVRYFDLKPAAVEQIRAAYDLGVGEMDLGKLKIREFDA
jgi:uncharacterized protein (DUF362 family)